MNHQIIPSFSVPAIIWGEIYKFSKKEINYVKNLALNFNNLSDNQISKDTFLLDQPILNSLRKFILKGIDYYAYDFLKIKKDSAKFYITQSWVNHNNPGQHHHPHLHSNSLFSGVFYFQGEKAPIQFHRGNIPDFPLNFQYESLTPYTAETYSVDIQIGKLFLFPSLLKHGVLMNKSSIPRISLSFNTFASGEFGKTSGLDQLEKNEF